MNFNQPFRAHPITIIEHFLENFWVVIGIILVNVDDFIKFVKSIKSLLEEQQVSSFVEGFHIILAHVSLIQLLIGSFALLFLMIFPIFITVRRWQKTWYQLSGDDFIVKRALLIKKNNHLHCSDISNINLTQNILERFTGTYKLKFDTNTSSTANDTDMSIVLSSQDAYALREAIHQIRSNHATSPSQNAIQTESDAPWYKSTINELLMHMVCQVSWGSIFISFIGLCWIITYLILNQLGQFADNEIILSIAKDFTEESFNWNFGIILPLLTFIIPIFQSTIGVFFKYYGFRVRRLKNELEVSYGFFTKKTYHLPISKINGLIYKQTLLQRLMGYASVEAINIGLGDGKNESRQILLSAHLPLVEKQIATLLPEFRNIESTLQPQPLSALWYILLTSGCTRLALYGTVLYFVPMPWKWLLLPLFLALPLRLYCAYKSPGVYANNDLLIIATGAVDRTIVKLPWQAMEQVSYGEGPLKRRFQLSKITYSILAHTSQQDHSTGIYSKDVCETLYHRIDPDAQKKEALIQ